MAHARIPESRRTRSRGRTARLIAVLAGVLILGLATFVGSSPDPALAATPSGPASPEQCAHLGTCAPAPSTSASQSSSPSAGCSGGGGGGGSSIWSDIGGLLKGAAGLATGNAASLAGPITHGVISSLFQWPSCSNGAGTWLVKSLVATPNYTQQGTNLSQVGKNTSAIGLGLLGATMSFAIILFSLSGIMSMGGGFAGAEGIARGVGAGVLIAVWPWAFGQFVAAANALSGAVVSSGMQARIGKLILGALALPGLNSVALIVMVILALLGLALLIGLLLLKMAIGATLAVIYVAMPILLALGVVPTFAWLPRLAAKALLTILLIPLIWAVIFAVFSAFALDSLTFGNFTYQGAGFWGTILRPLASLVLLVLMIKLPMQLARLASLSALIPGASRGGGGGVRGMASRAGSVAMGTAVGGAVRSQLPSSMGGQRPEMHYTRDAEGGAHVHRDSPPSMRRVRADSAEASGVRDEVDQERLRKKQERDGSKQKSDGRQNGRESSQQASGSAEASGQRNGQGTAGAAAGDPFAGGYTFGTNGQAAGSAAAGAAAAGGAAAAAGAAGGAAAAAGAAAGAAGSAAGAAGSATGAANGTAAGQTAAGAAVNAGVGNPGAGEQSAGSPTNPGDESPSNSSWVPSEHLAPNERYPDGTYEADVVDWGGDPPPGWEPVDVSGAADNSPAAAGDGDGPASSGNGDGPASSSDGDGPATAPSPFEAVGTTADAGDEDEWYQ